MSTYICPSRRLPGFALVAFLCSAILVQAQSTPAATQAPAPAKEEVVQLNPFTVTSEQPQGYMASNTISGTAMNTPLRDVPMAINVITSELISDMAAANLQDIFKMNSSVTQANRMPITNRNDAWSIRGFRNRNVLVDGVTAGDFIPPQLIDRVEVVKGPNTLYGQSDPGGLINIITKRPMGGSHVKLSSFAGNHGQLGVDVDVNTHAGQDNALGLRLLTGYNETDGFRPVDGSNNRYFGLESEYKLSSATTISLNANGASTRGIPSQRSTYSFQIIPTDLNHDGVITSTVVDGVNETTARYNNNFLPHDFTSATRGTTFEQDTWFLGLSLQHAFNAHLTSQYHFVSTQQLLDEEFREFNTFNAAGVATVNHTTDSPRNRTEMHTLQNVISFDTGPVAHRMLVGLRQTNDFSQNIAYALRNGPAGEVAALNNLIASGRNIRLSLTRADVLGGVPFWLDDVPTRAELTTLGTLISTNNYATTKVSTAYVTDSFNLMENRLKFLLGLRYVDITSNSYNFSSQRIGPTNNQDDTSYQAGAVHDLTRTISVFGNTATAFNPNGTNAATGQFYPAESSTAYEIGFKFENLWQDRITGTISWFDIKKSNVVNSDYSPTLLTTVTEISDQESRGLDVELFFNLSANWQIVTNYSYLDSNVTKSQTAGLGMPLEGAAPGRFTLWTSYGLKLGEGQLRFGGGLIAVHGPVHQFGTSSSRLVVQDDYTEGSVFVRYQTRWAGRNVSLGVNVNNLTDTFYLRARAATNEPRQLTFTFGMDL